MKTVKNFTNYITTRITCLLVCVVITSCNTFNKIPGVYFNSNELAHMHQILFIYPDSTYMAHYSFHGINEACDSGKWCVKTDINSIELLSTLPDPMSIPIDIIEEQANNDITTIIFNRPYKDIFINANGNEVNLIEWQLIIDGEKFLMDKDTFILGRKDINSIALKSFNTEEIRDKFWPPFVNNEIQTKTYKVRNNRCNKFTIILPQYVREKGTPGEFVSSIFYALPINKTISLEKLKGFKVD